MTLDVGRECDADVGRECDTSVGRECNPDGHSMCCLMKSTKRSEETKRDCMRKFDKTKSTRAVAWFSTQSSSCLFISIQRIVA